jgi:hypothetical protein
MLLLTVLSRQKTVFLMSSFEVCLSVTMYLYSKQGLIFWWLWLMDSSCLCYVHWHIWFCTLICNPRIFLCLSVTQTWKYCLWLVMSLLTRNATKRWSSGFLSSNTLQDFGERIITTVNSQLSRLMKGRRCMNNWRTWIIQNILFGALVCNGHLFFVNYLDFFSWQYEFSWRM